MNKQIFLIGFCCIQFFATCKSKTSSSETHHFKLSVDDTWNEYGGFQKPVNDLIIELITNDSWVTISLIETKHGSNYSTISGKQVFDFSKPTKIEHDDNANIYVYKAKEWGGELEFKLEYIQGPDYEGFALLQNDVYWNFYTNKNIELRKLQERLLSQ